MLGAHRPQHKWYNFASLRSCLFLKKPELTEQLLWLSSPYISKEQPVLSAWDTQFEATSELPLILKRERRVSLFKMTGPLAAHR